MSRAFVKDDDSNGAADVLPERPVGSEPNYVTATGLAQLRARYEALMQRHGVLKAEGERADGTLLAEVERDLRYYAARLESAIPVEIGREPPGEVHFGATVEARGGGELHCITIVGEDEADIAQGKVSWFSPLARALIGARVGDTVRWQRPAGDLDLQIESIRYPAQ